MFQGTFEYEPVTHKPISKPIPKPIKVRLFSRVVKVRLVALLQSRDYLAQFGYYGFITFMSDVIFEECFLLEDRTHF